jgi:hypothetical protein
MISSLPVSLVSKTSLLSLGFQEFYKMATLAELADELESLTRRLDAVVERCVVFNDELWYWAHKKRPFPQGRLSPAKTVARHNYVTFVCA